MNGKMQMSQPNTVAATQATLDSTQLGDKLSRFPRFKLLDSPTPLQPLRRLSAHLGGPEIWIKRDDLTGLAFGGNKVRQMEFFIGDALAAGADMIIGGGAYAQSNHSRIVAAAARCAGLEPVIVVRPGGTATEGGNALITRVLCDDLHVEQELADAPRDRLAEVKLRQRVFDRIAKSYRAKGRRPYCIYGSSLPLGVMGYVAATLELQRQFDELMISPDRVSVTSLGATQAGLELGARLLNLDWGVTGMAYMPTDQTGSGPVAKLVNEGARLLGIDIGVTPEEIDSHDEWAGPAYAAASALSDEALRLAATLEGLILDPIYSGKGMAGLIGAIRSGVYRRGQIVVFVHTGGQAGLFAHA
jgi:1-aminocyclopropane-1-carboxylate deaminase/D-cysteine desulfhydrase-like pyridoxal-dependent ACC family enzyme